MVLRKSGEEKTKPDRTSNNRPYEVESFEGEPRFNPFLPSFLILLLIFGTAGIFYFSKERKPKDDLFFVTQFRGTYSECLKEEKRKIYLYALLPENQARRIPLIRPPGNKNDG
jgi:hypothetical protein